MNTDEDIYLRIWRRVIDIDMRGRAREEMRKLEEARRVRENRENIEELDNLERELREIGLLERVLERRGVGL